MPQTSASAARTQTGEARKATMPRTSTALPAVRRGEKVSRHGGGGGRIRPGAADLLGQEAKRRVDEILIELAAADARRNRHFADLAGHARAEPEHGPGDTLGKRQQVTLDGHGSLNVVFRHLHVHAVDRAIDELRDGDVAGDADQLIRLVLRQVPWSRRGSRPSPGSRLVVATVRSGSVAMLM